MVDDRVGSVLFIYKNMPFLSGKCIRRLEEGKKTSQECTYAQHSKVHAKIIEFILSLNPHNYMHVFRL